MAGPNHVLPTGGTEFASPLSVDDFVKNQSDSVHTISLGESKPTDYQARAKTESLDGHAASITIRNFSL